MLPTAAIKSPPRYALIRVIPILLFTGACVAPVTQQSAITREDLQREQLRQRQHVLETDWRQQAKLEGVALPLLKAGVPLCGDRVAIQSGVRFTSALQYDRDWQPAARAAGLSDTLSVIVVTPGSAAERAGIRPGDRVVSFDGEPVPVGPKAHEQLASRFQKFAAQPLPRANQRRGVTPETPEAWNLPVSFAATQMPLQLQRGGDVIDVVVPMDTVCAQSVVVMKEPALNAFADGKAIYLTSSMMRFAAEPVELETVVAHEIAHNAMRHIDAKKKNALAGAIFGAVLDIAAASQGINTGGEYTNQMAALASMSFSQEFEREADYVGLYIMARAGHDIDQAANLWRRMAAESPGSIKFASSHPTTAERYVRIDRAVAEIKAKQAAGQPLEPELKR